MIFYELKRPEPGACEITGCTSTNADILCDFCNAQACPQHSYEWSYPTSRGYDHPPQKILCVNCANRLKDAENQPDADDGDPDDDPGRLRRRDGIAWEALRF